MGIDGREARVLQAVVTLVDSLLHDFDVVELLTDLTEHCATLLDVSSAGLLLADGRGQLHLMIATSTQTEEIELYQLQADEGPCLDCFTSGEPVSIADLDPMAAVWPQFVPAARQAGFASVHAVPMRAAGSALGTLGLFGTTTGSLNEADLLVGLSLAHVASVAIVQEHSPTREAVPPHLRSAPASHVVVVVEQAKGFVRERLDIEVSEAFILLRRYAQQYGTHTSDVAHQLMSEPQARPSIISGLQRLTTSC